MLLLSANFWELTVRLFKSYYNLCPIGCIIGCIFALLLLIFCFMFLYIWVKPHRTHTNDGGAYDNGIYGYSVPYHTHSYCSDDSATPSDGGGFGGFGDAGGYGDGC